jgi:hypothetical protein
MTVTYAPSKLYLHHVANLRELQVAIGNTERLAKKAIASRDPENSLRTLLRMYSFLVGAWAECRLKKLLHEEFGFSADERVQVESKNTQLEQWQHCIDLAFRKHHKITKAPLDQTSLGVTHAARRTALHDVLQNELKIIIEIRNKLAHGQWIYPFNNAGTAVESDKYKLINQENLLSLRFKSALIGHLADAVHELVVSPVTFERDFDTHFRHLNQVRLNLSKKSYKKYEDSLVESRRRARAGSKATN